MKWNRTETSSFGGDGKGPLCGFVPESPAAARARPALEAVLKKMVGWDRPGSMLSIANEEWEIGTFVGSEDDTVAGKGWRRDIL